MIHNLSINRFITKFSPLKKMIGKVIVCKGIQMKNSSSQTFITLTHVYIDIIHCTYTCIYIQYTNQSLLLPLLIEFSEKFFFCLLKVHYNPVDLRVIFYSSCLYIIKAETLMSFFLFCWFK